jgi:hypothetical protein
VWTLTIASSSRNLPNNRTFFFQSLYHEQALSFNTYFEMNRLVDRSEPEIAQVVDGEFLFLPDVFPCPVKHHVFFQIRFEGEVGRGGEIVQAAITQDQSEMGIAPFIVIIGQSRFLD